MNLKQRRENRRSSPRPSGRFAGFLHGLVSVVFCCVWDGGAVEEHDDEDSDHEQTGQSNTAALLVAVDGPSVINNAQENTKLDTVINQACDCRSDHEQHLSPGNIDQPSTSAYQPAEDSSSVKITRADSTHIVEEDSSTSKKWFSLPWSKKGEKVICSGDRRDADSPRKTSFLSRIFQRKTSEDEDCQAIEEEDETTRALHGALPRASTLREHELIDAKTNVRALPTPSDLYGNGSARKKAIAARDSNPSHSKKSKVNEWNTKSKKRRASKKGKGTKSVVQVSSAGMIERQGTQAERQESESAVNLSCAEIVTDKDLQMMTQQMSAEDVQVGETSSLTKTLEDEDNEAKRLDNIDISSVGDNMKGDESFNLPMKDTFAKEKSTTLRDSHTSVGDVRARESTNLAKTKEEKDQETKSSDNDDISTVGKENLSREESFNLPREDTVLRRSKEDGKEKTSVSDIEVCYVKNNNFSREDNIVKGTTNPNTTVQECVSKDVNSSSNIETSSLGADDLPMKDNFADKTTTLSFRTQETKNTKVQHSSDAESNSAEQVNISRDEDVEETRALESANSEMTDRMTKRPSDDENSLPAREDEYSDEERFTWQVTPESSGTSDTCDKVHDDFIDFESGSSDAEDLSIGKTLDWQTAELNSETSDDQINKELFDYEMISSGEVSDYSMDWDTSSLGSSFENDSAMGESLSMLETRAVRQEQSVTQIPRVRESSQEDNTATDVCRSNEVSPVRSVPSRDTFIGATCFTMLGTCQSDSKVAKDSAIDSSLGERKATSEILMRDDKEFSASKVPEVSKTNDNGGKKAIRQAFVEDAQTSDAETLDVKAQRGKIEKDSETPTESKATTSRAEDEHRRMFYKLDGRRKGGEVISDYYEFLVRLLNTGSSKLARQDPSHVTQVLSHVTVTKDSDDPVCEHAQKEKDVAPYMKAARPLRTASDGEVVSRLVNDDGASYIASKQALHDYYAKAVDIVPIEIELGLRSPRSHSPILIEDPEKEKPQESQPLIEDH